MISIKLNIKCSIFFSFKILGVCPDNSKPTSCSCSRGDKEVLDLPIESPRDFFKCLPEECTCEDGTAVPLPGTPSEAVAKLGERFLDEINTICDGVVPSTCTCAGPDYRNAKGKFNFLASQIFIQEIYFSADKTVEMPFEFAEDLIDCQPEECTCQDGSTQTPPAAPLAAIVRAQSKFIADFRPKELANQILSNFCNKGFTLEQCTCADESTIEAPFRPRKMFNCKPESCKCVNEDTDEEETINVRDLAKGPLKKIVKIDKDICPGDKPAESCSCAIPIRDSISAPFPNPLDIMVGCAPESCSCSDGSKVEINGESLIKKIR